MQGKRFGFCALFSILIPSRDIKRADILSSASAQDQLLILSCPAVPKTTLASDIVENLGAALEQFQGIQEELESAVEGEN